MIKWLQEQIAALEWLKAWLSKKSTKQIIIILAILLCGLFWWDTLKYADVWKEADKIYPEVLANIQELNLIISTEKDFSNINHSKYKFLVDAYEKDFSTNKQHLDKQLSNFYINLRKIEVFKTKDDFENIVAQGNYVKDYFNYYFGCKDYFDYIENQKNKPRAVSAEIVVLRFYLKNYLRYRFR